MRFLGMVEITGDYEWLSIHRNFLNQTYSKAAMKSPGTGRGGKLVTSFLGVMAELQLSS